MIELRIHASRYGGYNYELRVDDIVVGRAGYMNGTLISFRIFKKYRNIGYGTKFMELIHSSTYVPYRLHVTNPSNDNELSIEQLIKFYNKFNYHIVNISGYTLIMRRDHVNG